MINFADQYFLDSVRTAIDVISCASFANTEYIKDAIHRIDVALTAPNNMSSKKAREAIARGAFDAATTRDPHREIYPDTAYYTTTFLMRILQWVITHPDESIENEICHLIDDVAKQNSTLSVEKHINICDVDVCGSLLCTEKMHQRASPECVFSQKIDIERELKRIPSSHEVIAFEQARDAFFAKEKSREDLMSRDVVAAIVSTSDAKEIMTVL